MAEREKWGVDGKKKFKYLENEKVFVDEIKQAFFIVFKGYNLVKKMKDSRHKL